MLMGNETRWPLANSQMSHLKSETVNCEKNYGNNFCKYPKDAWPKRLCHNQIFEL